MSGEYKETKKLKFIMEEEKEILETKYKKVPVGKKRRKRTIESEKQ